MTDSVAAPEDARIAVTLSEIAYLEPEAKPDKQRRAMQAALADPALPTAGQWRVVWGPVTVEENLSYIAEGPGNQYAYVIRGTVMEPWNLIQDLFDALGLNPVPWGGMPGAEISDGMVSGWRHLTSSTDGHRTALEGLQRIPSGSKLIVTGHSLGAMLATVMSVYFASELGSRADIVPYTFAAPTAGNQAFADAYFERFGGAGRYYNCLDIVPKVCNHDDMESIKALYPCDGAPKCNLFCKGTISLGAVAAGHRYFHAAGGTKLQAKAYAEGSSSLKDFMTEALGQHHATHYMYLLGIPLAAIHGLDASWAPPEIPCPCPE